MLLFSIIPKDYSLEPGLIVLHDEELNYLVDDTRQSTVGYEETHKLGVLVVNYAQFEQGGFPPGTKWSKYKEGFRAHFTVEQRPDIEK